MIISTLTSQTDGLCVTVIQPAAVKVNQSAASSGRPTGEAPEGPGSRLVTLTVVYPGPTGGSSQVRVVPAACGSSAPTSGNIKYQFPYDKSDISIIIVCG